MPAPFLWRVWGFAPMCMGWSRMVWARVVGVGWMLRLRGLWVRGGWLRGLLGSMRGSGLVGWGFVVRVGLSLWGLRLGRMWRCLLRLRVVRWLGWGVRGVKRGLPGLSPGLPGGGRCGCRR